MTAHGNDDRAHEEEVHPHPVHSDPIGFLARLFTVSVIVLMVLIPYAKYADPSGTALVAILKYSTFWWALFISVEVLESAQRDFTAVWGWIVDNLFAVAALVIGALVLTGPFRFGTLTADEGHLLIEGIVWVAVDLVTGLLIPFVIAGSIKFRREER